MSQKLGGIQCTPQLEKYAVGRGSEERIWRTFEILLPGSGFPGPGAAGTAHCWPLVVEGSGATEGRCFREIDGWMGRLDHSRPGG